MFHVFIVYVLCEKTKIKLCFFFFIILVMILWKNGIKKELQRDKQQNTEKAHVKIGKKKYQTNKSKQT